jgi:hypothetical protein
MILRRATRAFAVMSSNPPGPDCFPHAALSMTFNTNPNDRSTPGRLRLLPLLFLVGALSPAFLFGQTATVVAEENVRSDPGGTVIGQLHPGASVTVVATEGNWSRITFAGAVWIPSLQVRDGGSYDLIVSAAEGENLRAEPSGPIIGFLGPGTLLEERRRIPGWVEVERTAWIWTPSLEERAGNDPARSDREPISSGDEGDLTSQVSDSPDEGSVWIRVPAGGSGILSSPDGDTLASARSGSELRMLDREGNWVRVRIEGWVWSPEGGDQTEREDDVIVRGVSASDLSGDPDRYRGRVVEMELQFISLERSEAVRSDFQEGEPFLLTRSADQTRAFVYVAIPSSEVDRIRGLTPLDRLVVVGRVRTGAAALTGNPVLDMLELRIVR